MLEMEGKDPENVGCVQLKFSHRGVTTNVSPGQLDTVGAIAPIKYKNVSKQIQRLTTRWNEKYI